MCKSKRASSSMRARYTSRICSARGVRSCEGSRSTKPEHVSRRYSSRLIFNICHTGYFSADSNIIFLGADALTHLNFTIGRT